MELVTGSTLTALLRDEPPSWRRILDVFLKAGAGVAALRPKPSAPLCQRVGPELDGVWDTSRKQAVEKAFGAVHKPYAMDALRSVERNLDQYAEGLAAARIEACEATRVRGEQSTELLDLRTQCLDRRLHSMRAMTTLLAAATEETVSRATQMVTGLPSLEDCAWSSLTGQPLPKGAEARARIEQGFDEIAETEAPRAAGRYPEGLERAKKTVFELRRLGVGVRYAAVDLTGLNGLYNYRLFNTAGTKIATSFAFVISPPAQ